MMDCVTCDKSIDLSDMMIRMMCEDKSIVFMHFDCFFKPFADKLATRIVKELSVNKEVVAAYLFKIK